MGVISIRSYTRIYTTRRVVLQINADSIAGRR